MIPTPYFLQVVSDYIKYYCSSIHLSTSVSILDCEPGTTLDPRPLPPALPEEYQGVPKTARDLISAESSPGLPQGFPKYLPQEGFRQIKTTLTGTSQQTVLMHSIFWRVFGQDTEPHIAFSAFSAV